MRPTQIAGHVSAPEPFDPPISFDTRRPRDRRGGICHHALYTGPRRTRQSRRYRIYRAR